MSNRKLYFKEEDSIFCYPKDDHICDADEDEIKQGFIELFEAIPVSTKSGYFWCRHYGETGETGTCGKHCGGYRPRNGISGICKHFAKSYTWGKKVKIKLK
jgi:hypothetical protein